MSHGTPEVSAIICSVDPGKFERVTASYQRAFAAGTLEIIGIHDARSLAEAYNRGMDQARGEILVFSHDDVALLSPDFGARVRGHLDRHDMIGIAGTRRLVGGAWFLAGDPDDFMLMVSPHPETGVPTMVVEGTGPLVASGIQALDGVFIAARAAIVRALRFDETNFDGFHLYDIDLTFRAYESGFALAVCRDLVLRHDSLGTFDAQWDRYRVVFERKHARRLPASIDRRQPRLVNVPLSEQTLADAARVAELCRPETLARFVAALQPGSRSGDPSPANQP